MKPRSSRPRGASLWWMVLIWTVLTASTAWAGLPPLGPPPTAVAASAVALSPLEQDWMRDHGAVRVAVLPGVEPYYDYAQGGGVPQGFAIELLGLMAERTGLALNYVTLASVADTAAALRNGSVDMTPIAAPSPAREEVASFPGALLSTELVLVTRNDLHDTSPAQNFAGRRLALVAGQSPSELLAQRYPDAERTVYPTTEAAYRAVSEGQADISVSWLHNAVYTIEANLLANLRIERDPAAFATFLGPAVSLHAPQLHNILAKAMASLTPAEVSAAARRWLPEGSGAHWAVAKAELSPAEQRWVREHPDLRVGFDKDFVPFTRLGPLGQFEGLGADVLRLAASKVGLRLIEQQGLSFAEVYDAARRGDIDVVAGMARSPQRLGDFQFVGPFASAPTGLLMRLDDPRSWSGLDDLGGARLGLLRNHFLTPRIRLRYPGLQLVEFDAQRDAMQALAQRRVDAVIGNSVVLQQLMQERFAGRLRLAGVVGDGESELYFGVGRREPELARVLRKGLAAITPSEQAELRQKWLLVEVQPGLDWRDLLRWALPLLLAAALGTAMLLLANRRLRQAHATERDARRLAEQANASRGRFLAYLAHELRGTLGAVSSGAGLLRGMQDPARRDALLDAMAQASDGLRQTLETTLAHERGFAAGLVIDETPTWLPDWWTALAAPMRLSAERQGLVLDVELAPELRLVFDSQHLGQVVTNLASNAVKFTPAGRVSLRLHWLDGDQRLRIVVADTGPGIPLDEQAGLFLPYAQGAAGKKARQGAGLGLAISRQIVDAMGGVIDLRSRPGEGSEFTVEVPARRDEAA